MKLADLNSRLFFWSFKLGNVNSSHVHTTQEMEPQSHPRQKKGIIYPNT